MKLVPNVVKSTPNGERGFDIYSRLLDDRIIMLDGQVDDEMASIIIAQLLYFDSINSNEPISMYINSPGGSVSAGLAIIDTMNLIKSEVATIGTGMSASMGAMILLSGEKGKRYVLPHSEVMIHQPLGGAQGQASDILITANHIERTRNTLYEMIADASGKTTEEIAKAADRDCYLTSQEAIGFGLVDEILTKK